MQKREFRCFILPSGVGMVADRNTTWPKLLSFTRVG